MIINYINKLEGWKTRCKYLHWTAPNSETHKYLDEFLSILSDYQDALAEGYMGITNRFIPDKFRGVTSTAINSTDLIVEIKEETIKFYEKLPTNPLFLGIISECENFMQNLNKYHYLFTLSK